MRDLDNPQEIGRYVGPTTAIDHNLYTKDNLVFETNYRAGLRILSTLGIANGELQEEAYFDTIPGSDSAQFSGTWSSYIYFGSGNVALSDIGNGLFVVTPRLCRDQPTAAAATAAAQRLFLRRDLRKRRRWLEQRPRQ